MRQHVLNHLRRKNEFGTKNPGALTADDVIAIGPVSLGKASGLWTFPFRVEGTRDYNALVDCEGYTELTGVPVPPSSSIKH
ncbi:hypothetical protein [Luteibacter yeojuensis]|uniref:Uncharacterized protein n=1 Tax=Luteibacter yeojuensis TaxID=345309 RepID=A0A0F3KHR0_9GAMM|nr:hypothetical protein [Luteibacter yeojuensis]KJV30743.1 hypothetical protein VI08_14770 [Luteibacter yeojuensis]